MRHAVFTSEVEAYAYEARMMNAALSAGQYGGGQGKVSQRALRAKFPAEVVRSSVACLQAGDRQLAGDGKTVALVGVVIERTKSAEDALGEPTGRYGVPLAEEVDGFKCRWNTSEQIVEDW